MLGGAQLCVRTVSGGGAIGVPTPSHHHHHRINAIRSIPNLNSYHCSMSLRFAFQSKRFRFRKPILIVRCHSSPGGGSSNGDHGDDDHLDLRRDDYLQASLLLSETTSHFRMRRRGFQEDSRGGNLFPFSIQRKEWRVDANFVGPGFLQRFQNPTIFLKISCDGEFLLPIVVGELAVERLLDAHWGDDNEDSPDQFQFLRNLVEKLGYEVNMPGEKDILSVDARPSDAINVANRCKAPIYVNKQIVITDAIRISYGMGRVRDTKSTYDVHLDSAADGPDLLSQELDLVKNINLAVKEERYKDAAMWKDKLLQLRKLIHGH
ncbi:bifunctional nuclease 2 isoform X2 [Morus notabilis]|uniref:bifunctional nuclease 2 isoform X2 n=1 Tax=Morus notabilis TaxID=981085 RepID=UPI000CECE6DC|nr:bifunctional nuclease 2 isoform X2 [Morus notabilis]